jgi:hypothetical protein
VGPEDIDGNERKCSSYQRQSHASSLPGRFAYRGCTIVNLHAGGRL